MADTRTQLAVLANNLNLTAEQQAQLATNLQTFKDQALLALDDDVARAQDGSRLTRAGFNLLGKALAGKQLKFTRAIIGDSLIDGQLTLPTDEEIFELTDVLNRRLEINLGKATFTAAAVTAAAAPVRIQSRLKAAITAAAAVSVRAAGRRALRSFIATLQSTKICRASRSTTLNNQSVLCPPVKDRAMHKEDTS